MSKGRYKRIEFKRIDWQGLRERVAGGRVVCAVDVAKTDFVATLLAADETALLTFQWEHPAQTPRHYVGWPLAGMARSDTP